MDQIETNFLIQQTESDVGEVTELQLVIAEGGVLLLYQHGYSGSTFCSETSN